MEEDEKNTDLNIELSIVTEEQGQDISLSDLYGVPIFREATEQAIHEYESKMEAQRERIDMQVFSDMIDVDKQHVERIRLEVFTETNQLTKLADTETQVKQSYTNLILLIEVIAIVFVVLIISYSKKRKKERKKKIDYIDHFSDETKE